MQLTSSTGLYLLKKKWRQEEGASKVLFNQDCLGEFDEVVLVEGELKAIALWQVGIKNVVSLTGGVGSIQASWVEQLKEKSKIYICLDSDTAGQNAVEKIAASVGFKKCVNIHLEDAKDPDEWLFRKGHSGDEFRELMASAQRVPKTSGLIFSPLTELMNEPDQEIRYVVDGMLPEGSIALLTGKPKCGKTTLSRQLAVAVAKGDLFLDRQTASGRVLYIGLEDLRQQTKKHFQRMGISVCDDLLIHAGNGIDPSTSDKELLAAIEEYGPVLVIIDTMVKFMKVRDTNDYCQVSNAFSPFIDLARKTGCSIVFVHHNRKSLSDMPSFDDILGSVGILAAVDTEIIIVRDKDDQRFISTDQRFDSDRNIKDRALIFDAETQTMAIGEQRKEVQSISKAREILVYLANEGEKTNSEIKEAITGSVQDIVDALKSLTEDGLVDRVGSGKKGDPYRYSYLNMDIPDHVSKTEAKNTFHSCSEPKGGEQKTEIEPVNPRAMASDLASLGDDLVTLDIDDLDLHGEPENATKQPQEAH